MRNIKRHGGFTLIELIVVVAILAILLSIAIPTYRLYLLRSQVRTAQADLSALSMNAENFLQRTLAYSDTDSTTTAATHAKFPGWSPAARDFAFGYDVTVAAGVSTYSVTATWTGTEERLEGCVITLTSANARTMSPECEPVMGATTW